jgi:primosomal protein N' (replication factor Y)
MAAMVAGEAVHQPVLDHPRGAIGALEAMPAVAAQGQRRAAAAVEEQQRLLAGRAERPGRVFLQTYDPAHPVIAALVAGDGPGFYAAETAARREAAMPPFGRLAAIIISAENAGEAETVARRIGQAAPRVEGMAVFGPAPAPLAMLRGRHRQRILVHAARSLDVQDVIRDWLASVEWGNKVRVAVDVDPYSFL